MIGKVRESSLVLYIEALEKRLTEFQNADDRLRTNHYDTWCEIWLLRSVNK